MMTWPKLRAGISKAFSRVALMVAGAWLLVQYLQLSDPLFRHSLDRIEQYLYSAFLIFLLAGSILQEREGRAGRDPQEPSPRWSGVSVILLTGFSAVIFVTADFSASGNFLLPSIIVVATLALGGVVWRFASNHADEIGEARFKTQD